MRLNFVCPELQGAGGTETVLKIVINHFSVKYDIRLFLTNIPRKKEWLSDLNNNVKIYCLKRNGKLNKIFYLTRCFLSSNNKDVFIILGGNILKYFYYLNKIFKRNNLLISWIHFSLTSNLFDPNNLKKANYNWAISKQIKEQMLNLGINENHIELIYNPVKREPALKSPKDKKNIRLLYIGRIMFNGQKNLQLLLKTIKNIKNVKLDIYGVGEDINKCEKYCVENNLTGKVIWHGWNKNPWDDIVVQPDAIVLSSIMEGLPMVILEAFSRGIPAIVSRFVGYDNLIIEGVNGYSYKVNDERDLAKKILKIREQNLGTSKIQNSINGFYEDNYFRKLENILNNYAKKWNI
ncbi:glycosyltransferase [Lactobacillus helveticus]|uniref:glycosyltransferase n=1 Tax=Lactobacillus helveticus TaxID=1587 RepID=UPI001564B0D1|nr:glycosyltransferase [Lactobacillus helveticus]NRO93655.1 Poly(glycerol-phosphate) alpha-glucosyltransferase [Lactobacillus helveticus]